MNALGDALTPDQLSIADDLYYQRIPETWRRAAGAAAPPPLQALNTFINDIVARSTHFERILVLVSNELMQINSQSNICGLPSRLPASRSYLELNFICLLPTSYQCDLLFCREIGRASCRERV